MKKMIFILLIMTAFLASPVLANLLNPSFEYSIQSDPAGEADYWTWETPAGLFAPMGTIEYVTDDAAGARTGDDYYKIRQNSQGWVVFYQDSGLEFPLDGITELDMVAYFRTDNAPQGIAWKAEWYEEQGQTYFENVGIEEVTFDVTSTDWQEYTHTFTSIPETANYVKFVIVAWNTDWVFVDDCWVGESGSHEGGAKPRLPQPENKSIQSVLNSPSYGYTPVTDLSWINPGLIEDSVLFSPTNLGIEVKFDIGVYDGNEPDLASYTGTGIETVALSALTPALTLPLADDTSYYWQVIVTDANSAGPVVTTGNIWTFETGDVLPIVQAPAGEYMWLTQDDSGVPGGDGPSNIRYFKVEATYTDDGKSAIVGDPSFSTYDLGWNPPTELGVIQVSSTHTADPDGPSGEQSGTVTEIYRTENDGTYETVIPGRWNFSLDVMDATDRTTSGDTGSYYIGETCAQAADENPDDTFDTTYDADGNCRIDTVDLAALCAKWLDESTKFE
ncbi:MAG: hypothetical protein H8E62_07965 [Planctomycetes bacterium]|nr:hypothetical protein [Planctomycetota bacterium]